jgi:hypothetical protein
MKQVRGLFSMTRHLLLPDTLQVHPLAERDNPACDMSESYTENYWFDSQASYL